MMIVEQLGLAIRPLCLKISCGFTSGTTSGMPSFIRNALVLSTTIAPAATAAGANSLLIDPPALKNAILTSLNESFVSSSTVYVLPMNSTVLPAERADASSFRFLMGNLRSARTLRNSWPTAPVAPTMATLTDMGGSWDLRFRIRDPKSQLVQKTRRPRMKASYGSRCVRPPTIVAASRTRNLARFRFHRRPSQESSGLLRLFCHSAGRNSRASALVRRRGGFAGAHFGQKLGDVFSDTVHAPPQRQRVPVAVEEVGG